ncbi:MAG: MarR family transcriptional regulator [Paracoccaceae bacterium]
MDSPPKYRLHHSLGYHLSLAARMQERRLDDWLRPLGLTRITWCILLAVENEGLTRPSEIAGFVGIDRTATSRALRQMEASGLLTRKAADTDRRMTEVALSTEGRALVAKGTPLAQANNRLVSAKLTSAESKELKKLLEKLLEGEELALKRL